MPKNREKSETKSAAGSAGGSQNKITAILKFVFFILLLPLVIGVTVGFMDELKALPPDLSDYFVKGILIYLLVHLFIYKPQHTYQYGQNLVTVIFQFFAPLVKVASFVLPIYSLIFLIAFYIATAFFHSPEANRYLIFLVSFTLTMHMAFTADVLRGKDSNAAKPHYFFAMSLVYVINAFIFALLFDLILKEFSFQNFFDTATSMAANAYKSVFEQLFMP